MKPDSPFSKLPSLSDLLGHPAVSQVIKRVNQTTIAQRAASFLEEFQTNLRNRFDPGQLPSLGQLAERFARRLLGPAQTSAPVVNATGTLLGDRWPTLPLAEQAVDEMVRIASEYHAGPQVILEQISHVLHELTSAESSLLVSSFDSAQELCRSSGVNCDIARYAGFLNPSNYGYASLPTISEHPNEKADAILVDGAGLIGGPPCGIVLGRSEVIERISSASATLVTPSHLTLAALAATLTVYQSGDQVIHQIPIWQLLTTPLENLEQRSHRLAMLIGAMEHIEAATPTKCDATWLDTPETKLAAPTWAIVIKPQPTAFERCINSLVEANPQILARIQQEDIWLDMRGVFPRWDQHLVQVLGG